MERSEDRIVFIDSNDRSLAPTAALRMQYWINQMGVSNLPVTSRGIERVFHGRMGIKSLMLDAFRILSWYPPSATDPLDYHVPKIMSSDNLYASDFLIGFNHLQIDEFRHKFKYQIELFGRIATGKEVEIFDPEDQSEGIFEPIIDWLRPTSRFQQTLAQIRILVPNFQTDIEGNPAKLRLLTRYISTAQRIDHFSQMLAERIKENGIMGI